MTKPVTRPHLKTGRPPTFKPSDRQIMNHFGISRTLLNEWKRAAEEFRKDLDRD